MNIKKKFCIIFSPLWTLLWPKDYFLYQKIPFVKAKGEDDDDDLVDEGINILNYFIHIYLLYIYIYIFTNDGGWRESNFFGFFGLWSKYLSWRKQGIHNHKKM